MAYRWLGVLLLGAACVVIGCGEDGGGPRSGTGGSAGTGGIGGQSGSGGGSAGTGGSEPTGCNTSLLCSACPAERLCETNDDCADGLVCIETGCDDLDGLPMKQCTFAGGGACNSDAICLEQGRQCIEVPGEGKRCVKLTPGCATSFDCVRGFTCEEGACVDRRVPCNPNNGDEDCPMNHVCGSAGNSSFCVRIHTDCLFPFDCVDVAPTCVDIDGDERLECAGSFDANDPTEACTNDQCSADPGGPVCEASTVSSTSVCGNYGLCLDDGDCADGFGCVALWPDGRKECVPDGGTCASYRDCDPRQVCASPRQGGPPSCQGGVEP